MNHRPTTSRPSRPRWICTMVAMAIIPLGLATRSFGFLPDWITSHAGDALWAALVYWLVATLFPGARVVTLAALALGISFAVEFSQLIDHPLLNRLRANRLGALALGRGFLPVDLIRYTGGVCCAVLLDWAVATGIRRHNSARQSAD